MKHPYLLGPGGQISWGMDDDNQHGFNAYSTDPAAYVAECRQDGIEWHSMLCIPTNENNGLALHDAAHSVGAHFGGWVNAPQSCGDMDALHDFFDRFARMKCGFLQVNIEERWGLGGTDITDPHTVNNCHQAFASEFRKRFPRIPACVQTNFGGFEKREPGTGKVLGYDQDASAIYIKYHFECMHEDYWVNNHNLVPIEGDYAAHNLLLWPRPSASTAGIFGSETGLTDPDGNRLVNTIAMEIPRLVASKRHHVEWIWTMEYMTEQDRADMRTKGRAF